MYMRNIERRPARRPPYEYVIIIYKKKEVPG